MLNYKTRLGFTSNPSTAGVPDVIVWEGGRYVVGCDSLSRVVSAGASRSPYSVSRSPNSSMALRLRSVTVVGSPINTSMSATRSNLCFPTLILILTQIAARMPAFVGAVMVGSLPVWAAALPYERPCG